MEDRTMMDWPEILAAWQDEVGPLIVARVHPVVCPAVPFGRAVSTALQPRERVAAPDEKGQLTPPRESARGSSPQSASVTSRALEACNLQNPGVP